MIIFSIFVSYVFSANKDLYTVKAYEGNDYNLTSELQSSYQEYLNGNSQTYPNQTINILAKDFFEDINNYNVDSAYVDEFSGKEGLYIPETNDVAWKVEILEAGYYNKKFDYKAIEGRS